jgi:nitrite reductase/ring-hydroxylating ferredoxin subunit
MTRFRIGDIDDMAINTVRQLLPPGRPPIALYRLPDGFHATDDRCTHGDASLSEGEVEGDEIVCPFHLGRFDIRSGEATAAPCVEALSRYAVSTDADGVSWLELPD